MEARDVELLCWLWVEMLHSVQHNMNTLNWTLYNRNNPITWSSQVAFKL